MKFNQNLDRSVGDEMPLIYTLMDFQTQAHATYKRGYIKNDHAAIE